MSYGYGEPRPGVPRQVSTPVPAATYGIMKSPSQGALPVTDLNNDAGSPAGVSTLSGSGRGPLLVASRPAPSSSLLAAALRAPPPPSGADHPKDASAFMAMLKASAAPQPQPSAPTVSQTPPTVSAMPGSPVTPHHAHTASGGAITAPASHPPPSPASASTPGASSAPGTPQEREDDSPDEEEAAKEPALKPQPGMTQMDKRKLVLLEIVNTERDYLNDLDLIVEMFVKPMTERQLLKPMEIATIFSNVQELIGINKEFLKLLENSRAEVGADMGAMRVAEDFSRMVEPFKRYGRYFADQAFALSTLEKCQASVAPFGQFVQECMMNPRARGLSFFAFLIKPVQRICKYPLLLRELIKTTPDTHPDYASLLEAAKDIEALVAMLNEKKRATETHQKVLELMTSVEALEQQPAFVKGSSSRYFIFEAEMKVGLGKKGVKMRAYLFNDVLLYHHTKERHKKEEGKRFEFGGVVPINQYTRAVDIADSAEDNNVFALRHAEGTVSFVCNTPEDKKKWIKEVKGRIGDTIKKDLKNRSDTPTRADTPTRNGRPSTPLSSSTPTLGNTGGASVVDMLFASSSTPVASSPPARTIPASGSGASHTWSGSSAPRPTLEKLPSSDAATVSGAGAAGASKQQAISRGESWMDVLSTTTGTSAPSSSALSPSNSSSALPNSVSAAASPTAAPTPAPAPLPSPGSLGGSSSAGFSSSAFSKPAPRPEALPGAQPGSGSSLPAAFFQGAKPFARGISNPNFRPTTPTALGASADRSSNAGGANHSPPSSVAPGAPSFLIGTSPPTPEPATSTSFVAPATAQEPAPAPIAPSASRDSGAGLLLYTPAGIQGSGSNSGANTPTGRGTPTAAGERQTAAALMVSLGFPPSAKQSRLRGSIDPEIAASVLGAAPTPTPAPAHTAAVAAPTPARDFPRTAPPPVPAEASAPAPAPTPAPASQQREFPRAAPPAAPASDPAPIPAQAPPAAQPVPVSSPPTQSPPQATPPPAVYNPAYPAPASAPPAAVKAGVAKQLVTVVKQPVVAKQQLGSIAPKK